MRFLRLLPLLCVVALALAGCGGDKVDKRLHTGQPRSFVMGVSSLPADVGEKPYRDAFDLAGLAGDVVLIQRAPPWADFLPGATISDRTQRLTRFEKELAHAKGLKLFLAVDPTDPADRGRLAGLPADLSGVDFSDERVRAAFIAYAKYAALNYKPAYLALGVEVDMFYARRGDGAFRNFQSLYFEAYTAAKQASPSTLIFPTFQYEDMLGILNTGEKTLAAWSLVNRFEPKIDMLAVSSYPGFVFPSVDGLPRDYYDALKGRLQDKPIAFASIGWSSVGALGASSAEGETDQDVYLRRVLADAEDLKAKLIVWYLARDPTATPAAGFEPLANMGLHTVDDRPKKVWTSWVFFADRPPPG